MITYFIRYEIDPSQKHQVTVCASNWARIIVRLSRHLLDYFTLQVNSNLKGWHFIPFPSMLSSGSITGPENAWIGVYPMMPTSLCQ